MNYVRPMSSKGVTEVETGSSPVLRLWVEPLLSLINGIFLARLFRQIAVKAEVFFRCKSILTQKLPVRENMAD